MIFTAIDVVLIYFTTNVFVVICATNLELSLFTYQIVKITNSISVCVVLFQILLVLWATPYLVLVSSLQYPVTSKSQVIFYKLSSKDFISK